MINFINIHIMYSYTALPIFTSTVYFYINSLEIIWLKMCTSEFIEA